MLKLWKLNGFNGAHLLALGVMAALLLTGCGDSLSSGVTATALPALPATTTPVPATPLPGYPINQFGATTVAAELNGSGSSFAEPVYKKWIELYSKVSAGVKINYQATGSGSGRAAFLGTPVTANPKPVVPSDFAGSDASFTGQELVNASAKGDIVHIPTVLGGITVSYRLDGFQGEVRLSGPTLARIFLGEIKEWNNADITADNGGVALPTKPISVVIRSRTGSSGTSEIFSRYLSAVSSTFREKVGPGGAPKWPTFGQLEGATNDEVGAAIKGRDGAIGYIDQGAADALELKYASIRNQSGRYIRPTVETVTAAARGVAIPDDFRIFVVNAEGENAYPIAGFTWIIVWKDFGKMPGPSAEKAQALANFLWWAIHDGQKTENLPPGFAPLPNTLIPRLQTRFVNSDTSKVFQFNSKPIFNLPGKS